MSRFLPSRLQIALLFGEYDLRENRSARLSFAQRQRVLWSSAYYPVAALFVLSGMLAFEYLLWFVYGVFSLYATPMGFVVGVGGFVLLLRAWWPHVADAFQGRVETVEGILVRRSTMGIFRRIYYVRVGDHAFEMRKWAYDQFAEGPWRCYFLPRTRRLLSAEPGAS